MTNILLIVLIILIGALFAHLTKYIGSIFEHFKALDDTNLRTPDYPVYSKGDLIDQLQEIKRKQHLYPFNEIDDYPQFKPIIKSKPETYTPEYIKALKDSLRNIEEFQRHYKYYNHMIEANIAVRMGKLKLADAYSNFEIMRTHVYDEERDKLYADLIKERTHKS